jgi:hypothetical protein
MREAFAHEALVSMEPAADPQALGAAVTLALCGHWQHEPPCPLAPHHTRADRVRVDGGKVRVRTLFAAEPAREAEVRRRIDAALDAGELSGPDGVTTLWQLLSSRPVVVDTREAAHAQRLIGS